MIIRKSYFARNQTRDHEDNSIIDKIYRNYSLLGKVLFVIILAPTIVVGSIFSQATFLIIANLLLSLAFLVGFANRLYKKEADFAELIITVAIIGALFLLAFYFLPSVPAWGVVSVLCIINLVATSINVFSVLREVLVPPLQSVIHHILKACGFNPRFGLYHKKNFEINDNSDQSAITRIRQMKFDTPGKEKKDSDILPNVQEASDLLSSYINKYQGELFGAINNCDSINTLKSAHRSLLKGNPDSSYGFFQVKYNRKKLKVTKLMNAKEELESARSKAESEQVRILTKYFVNTTYSSIYKFVVSANAVPTFSCIDEGIKLLEKEINRQKEKIDKFNACMPDGYAFKEPDLTSLNMSI